MKPARKQSLFSRFNLKEVRLFFQLYEMEDFAKKNFEFMVLSSVSDAIVTVDLQMNITYCNPAVENVFGFGFNEIAGKPVQVMFHQNEMEVLIDFVYNHGKDRELVRQMKCIHKDGHSRELNVAVSFLKNSKHEPDGLVFVFHDITEVKRLTGQLAYTVKEMEFANREMLGVNSELESEIKLRNLVEEELRQQKIKLENLNANLESIVSREVEANREKERLMVIQSRQASMGEIIESVAHQWKQPLNTINLLLYEIDELAKGSNENYAYVKDKISDIYSVIRYMADTIDDFRSFFLPGREKQSFLLADAILHTSKFLDAEYRHSGIEVEYDLDNNLQFNGFQNEITQVILNILNNARDAFAENRIENPLLKIGLRKDNSRALITIEDNAGGIPDELLPEIFNAYISTKSEGKGTGLGLYIARSIVENNLKGIITAKNTNSGVVFSIVLPLSADF